jgi:hypothetical protein
VAALTVLAHHSVLQKLTLADISCYARLISHLKWNILQPQPLHQSNFDMAPEILPPSIAYFLQWALDIPANSVQHSWDILKDYLWNCKKVPLNREDYETFKKSGLETGISK